MRAVNIDNLWDFCIESRGELSETTVEVGSNHNLGVSVYVTVEPSDDDYFAIWVVQDGEEIFEEVFSTEEEALDVWDYIRDFFLEQTPFDIIRDRGDLINGEDRIYERETELDEAVIDFLDVAYSKAFFDQDAIDEIVNHFSEEIVDGVKNRVLSWLAKEYDDGIYRPCVMVDDEGNEFIENFPYRIEGILGYPDEDYEFDEEYCDDEEEDD